MGRMKNRDFQIIKEGLETGRYGYGNRLTVIRGLIYHAEAIEKELHEVVAKFGQADKTIDRLTENVAQLQREIDAKKVTLPREVAEALDLYVSDGHDENSKGWALFNIVECDRVALDEPAGLIQDYFDIDYFSLASAIVNGYTIEEPPSTEDKIVASLTQALEEMQVESPVPVERLAKVLTHAIREVLAEDRQEEE